ncbi:hypothetical protein D9M68_765260 [compost metagenome]
MAAVGRYAGRQRDVLASSGNFFEHQVRDFDSRRVGLFIGVASGDRSGNVRDMDADGRVVVAPFDGDWVLHVSLLRASGQSRPARFLMLRTVPMGRSFFG